MGRSRKAGSDSEEEYRGRGRGFSDHEEDLDEAMQVGTALLALHSQSHSLSQDDTYLQHKIAAKKKAVTKTGNSPSVTGEKTAQQLCLDEAMHVGTPPLYCPHRPISITIYILPLKTAHRGLNNHLLIPLHLSGSVIPQMHIALALLRVVCDFFHCTTNCCRGLCHSLWLF